MPPAPKPTPAIRDDGFREFVRSQHCVLWDREPCKCGGYYDPTLRRYATRFCHVRTRRNNGDVANGYPACDAHHAEQHRVGIKTFQSRHSLDLKAIAAELWATYRSHR